MTGNRLYLAVMLVVATVVAMLAHTLVFTLDVFLAFRGVSVLENVAAHADPQAFERDFPGGANLTTSASPTVHIYHLGHDLFGLDGMVMLYGMILVEIGFVIGGLWLLWSAVLESFEDGVTTRDPVSRLAFVALVLVIVTGSVQMANMAKFGFPYYHGQFYGFADGLRLAAIAMVLKRRWEWAALAFALCFTLHPIKALMAAALVLGLLAVDWRRALTLRALTAMGMTVAAWITWYMVTLHQYSQGVPLDAFIAYTRASQVHWYPMDMGLLTTARVGGLSPFLALLLMIWIALLQPGWPERMRNGLAAGIALLAVLTAVGIWISAIHLWPGLIRISVIRASTMVSLVGPLILLAGAVLAWQAGRKLMFAGFLAFLLVGFEYLGGLRHMAPVFALGVALAHVAQTPRDLQRVSTPALPIAATIAWLAYAYPKPEMPFGVALPALWATMAIWILLHAEAFLARWHRAVPWLARLARIGSPGLLALTLLFLAGAVHWSQQRITLFTRNEVVARAYLETQIWARANTPSGSLFMVDPCHWYGWRDFSHRASIGTMREWYMTAWLYTDRGDLLDLGHRIAGTLGAALEPHEVNPQSRTTLCKTGRAAYYHPDLVGPRQVAEQFGVDYFVFETARMKEFPETVTSRLVFRNDYYAVLPANGLAP